ncbi:MAG: TIGR04372 family glycosyltransferase [Thalassobaculum sp.]|uniref:TIGR04372 family glycosyltransferase n=1 Tax=Thalassobaculum sp. TaxID=2022740 RepID=UPI0032ED4690
MNRADPNPKFELLRDPGNAGELASLIRAATDPTEVFEQFRRLLLLPGAYVQRDVLVVEGDVIRKALRASSAIPSRTLAKVANASPRYHRTITSFIAACLLVSGRLDDATRNAVSIEYGKCPTNFDRAIAIIGRHTSVQSMLQAQMLVSEKNYLTIVLRAAGYSDLALEIGRHVAKISSKIHQRVHQDKLRVFTDRWTFAIGHIVILAYLVKAQGSGLTPYGGIRIWNGGIANRYLMDRVSTLSDNFDYIRSYRFFGELHSVNHAEIFDDQYLNYFDTCGVIADKAGDETGAILERPALSDPAFETFRTALGLQPSARIVTLHCREAGYRVDSRHGLRNVDIATYLPAIRRLVERGYTVIRLGDRSMTPLPKIPGVFDYARSTLKSPELDVLLTGVATFHIGSSSGLSLVPQLFGTPCLYLNWYPLDMMPWGRRNWSVLRPMRHLDGSGRVTDPSVYFRYGRMPDRALLNACGVEPENLTAEQVEHAVEAFVDGLSADRGPPDRTGRNIGPVLIAGADGADEPFIRVPTETIR